LRSGESPFPTLGAVALSDDGTELRITNNRTDDVSIIPFDLLDNLAGPPAMAKLRGDANHEPCLALLANLDLRANPQSEEPFENELPRGHIGLAVSFLPAGTDLAVGLGSTTFPRMANDIWHTQLRADDGSHPLPSADDRRGTWDVVSMAPQLGRVRIALVGEVPIDIWPDATVRVDLHLTPTVENGVARFRFDVESDVDTGVLGDLFGGLVGGLLGLLLGVLSGGMVLPFVVIGFEVGVLAIEIAESVVGGVVTRFVKARIDDELVPPPVICDHGVAALALPAGGGGLAASVLNAVPRSLRIATDQPDSLHRRHTLVVNRYDTAVVDGSGVAFTATAERGEAFEPVRATLVDAVRPDDDQPLTALVYDAAVAGRVQIAVGEAVARAVADELAAPLRPTEVADARPVVPAGKIPIVCLTPQAIRRDGTVITDIQFTTGLELSVPEAATLQDAGVLVLPELQLIHPSNGAPYFRSKPDDSADNNFENLPPF
jgi:hypothetical protein